MSLPITIYPRQPESYQLSGSGLAVIASGFIPPNAFPSGSKVGNFHTLADTRNFTATASRIKTSGRVVQNFFLGVTRTISTPTYAPNSSDSLVWPVDVATVGATDFPIYATPRDRIEVIVRLWHDNAFSVSSVFACQLADFIDLPLNMEVYGFEIYVNSNTVPAALVSEVFTVMFH